MVLAVEFTIKNAGLKLRSLRPPIGGAYETIALTIRSAGLKIRSLSLIDIGAWFKDTLDDFWVSTLDDEWLGHFILRIKSARLKVSAYKKSFLLRETLLRRDGQGAN
jgi:hypothetical protein